MGTRLSPPLDFNFYNVCIFLDALFIKTTFLQKKTGGYDLNIKSVVWNVLFRLKTGSEVVLNENFIRKTLNCALNFFLENSIVLKRMFIEF